jgi:Kef-type K+ transport system membrane component KefB
MKSISYRNPHLTVRIITSFVLQILIVVLLHRHHQDSTACDLAILAFAVLAVLPLSIRTSCLKGESVVILGLVGLFSQVVILAIGLNLLGWNWLLNWLLRFCGMR